MRADRLVSLVLLLRHRGRMSAPALARALEVSPRTVLRDVEALSAAGVPVYAERGRNGGFALLPGFRSELTGLNHDEALALLLAGSRRGAQVFGLGSALASAMLKVVDALPADHRDTATAATQRLLVDPPADLLSRPLAAEEIPDSIAGEVRRAVLGGLKLRLLYAAPEKQATWRTVDPIGLVTAKDNTYLLATHEGADRTYLLSRVTNANALTEPADRAPEVNLTRTWQARATTFRHSGDHLTAHIRIAPHRRPDLAATALSILTETTAPDGTLHIEATFQDTRHAEWALWHLTPHAEALTPQHLRDAIHTRATQAATTHTPSTNHNGTHQAHPTST